MQGSVLTPGGQLRFVQGHHDGSDSGLRLFIAGASSSGRCLLSSPEQENEGEGRSGIDGDYDDNDDVLKFANFPEI